MSTSFVRLARILFAAGVGALCLSGTVDVLRAEEKILFIGNSYTLGLGGTASVPAIFEAMAKAGGQGSPLVQMRAVMGQDFKYHYENSLDVISQEPWTHVVLQNYSTEPTHVGNLSEHYLYGGLLYEAVMANRAGTRIHLYQTWARASEHAFYADGSFDSPAQMLDELKTNYQGLADRLNVAHPFAPAVTVNPVGEAWWNAGGNLSAGEPGYIDLYYTDDYHGNDRGYYLSACVHYACIYAGSPVGLFGQPSVAALGLDITADEAFALEQAAWDTVQGQPQAPVLTGTLVLGANQLALVFSREIDASVVAASEGFLVGNRGRLVAVTGARTDVNGRTLILTLAEDLSGNFLVDYSGLGTGYGSGQVAGNVGDAYDVFIDFSTYRTVSAGAVTWNGVGISDSIRDSVGNGERTPYLLAGDLADADGRATGISLVMTDAMGGNNVNGTSAGTLPVEATSDSFYGQTGDHLGFSDNGQGCFELRNLDPQKRYSFTFYASRTGVSDNRETLYTVVGTTSHSASLDTANNEDSVACVAGIAPSASGVITLQVSAGSANTSNKGYYYLGAVKISVSTADVAPQVYPPVRMGNTLMIDWAGPGLLETADKLGTVWTRASDYCAPTVEVLSEGERRFYRLHF
ncbi:hypothetical protein H5P28_15825 [Ruficoccus amylovorans]|uniref:DUF4886 domain-containing protein n=1 Tax=Ruficoccus amylovorans TaxID=1804625 RepID=A0A842HJI5_9BACT|nr:hypothetical protein [Ruficoccus amylovorans]MBC2595736.1 hypothetical protein [Ruficoccus amylovorans]